MSEIKEYVVTLHSRDDLEEFYQDMETLRATAYNCMPERIVDVAVRRPTSRNTHYWMTEEEAVVLRQDPRVRAVMLKPKELGMVIRRSWSQTSTSWNKSNTLSNTHVNWGLLRVIEGQTRAGWGSDSTNGMGGNESGTVSINEEGRNVDVIIVDGHINPAHPEYANLSTSTTFAFQNSGFNYSVDGQVDTTFPTLTVVRGQTYYFNFTNVTSSHPIALRLADGVTLSVTGTTGNNASSGVYGNGTVSTIVTYQVPFNAPSSLVYQCVLHPSMIGTISVVNPPSRVVQLDWHTLTPTVVGLDNDAASVLTSSYVYTPYTGGTDEEDNNHGAHVAGTTAGNAQGWARSANIYNISPYSTNPNGLDELVLFDYIRAFHNTKSINPITGRRNPTICNHSWGYGYQFNLTTNPVISINFRGTTINGPFTEAQLRGYGLFASGGFFYAPAGYPALDADAEDAIADGIIMVAAASNDYTKVDVLGGQDYNNTFTLGIGTGYYHRGSSPGKAEGVICVGSVDVTSTEYKASYSNNGPRVDIFAPGTKIISSVNSNGTVDIRNNTYRVDKYSGTSMASPQVCGVLACVLETYPNLTPGEALAYITNYAKSGQLTDTGGALDDYQSLQGASNLYLAYNKERKNEGAVFPKLNYKIRPSTGAVYPRVRRG